MHDIKITYRYLFRERTIRTTFPENWSEINPDQFTILFRRPGDIRLLSEMLGVKRRIIKKLDLHQIYELAKLCDFIRQDSKINNFKLREIHVPKAGVLFAPLPKMAEMSFQQFIYADSFYMQYAANPSPELLRTMVAYLYIPEQGFDKKTAEHNVKHLKKVKTELLEAIVVNYGWVRKWMVERYPLVFPIGVRTPEKNSTGSWPDVFDSIVGDDLKDRDKYARLPINVVFKYITRKIKESRRNAAKIH